MSNHEHNDHGHSSDHDHTEGKRQYYPKGWYLPLFGLLVIALGFGLLGGFILENAGTDTSCKEEQHVCNEHCGADCKEKKEACEKDGHGKDACCDKDKAGHDAGMKEDAKHDSAPKADSAKAPEAAKPEAAHGH